MYYRRKQSLAFLLASVLLPRVCAGQSADAAAKSPILGVVEGQPITEDDLAPQLRGQLGSLREQEYRIKKQGLDVLINQKLIEAEAKKGGSPRISFSSKRSTPKCRSRPTRN